MPEDLLGKWVMGKGEPLPGLWFEFKADGTYAAELPGVLKIISSGTYEAHADGTIELNQTEHTMGLVGLFQGRYLVSSSTLKLSLSAAPGGPRPADLSQARLYNRA
jgi:hypothetical protein